MDNVVQTVQEQLFDLYICAETCIRVWVQAIVSYLNIIMNG